MGAEVSALQEMIPFIGSLGFPIVAYLLMFMKFDKTLSSLTETINNNTQAVKLLLQREGVKDNE